MKIVRSRYAGACYGVERALTLVNKAASEDAGAGETAGTSNTSVYTLGPLIHNPQVVSELRARGVEQADTVDEVEAGVLVIRSHGVAPAVIKQAQRKELRVVDATCPHVSKAHEAARQLREQGYLVVVVGELGHPEVEGIRAYAGDDAIVVQEPSDLPENLMSDHIGVVVQTTQAMDALEAIVGALQKRGVTPTVRNTICFATRQRQEAATELAAVVDVMLVVGGRNSGNTTRLAKLCAAVCPRTYHIESAAELDATWFAGTETIGITAGASTPENQIIAVEQALRQLS
jgi:4-hydroxy-3-methylbut-2-enyl diphosphate reductase